MAFENPLTRIIIPPNGPETEDPYVDVGTARKPDGTLDNTFAGIALYSPGSLPDGYAYIMRIAETDPNTTVFVIQLYDHNNPGAAVKSVLSATYDKVADTQILNVGGNTDILAIGPDAGSINIGGPGVDVDIETASLDVTDDIAVGGNVTVTGDIVCDTLTVTGNDITGDQSGTLFIGFTQPIVQVGGAAGFDRLWIGSSGNNTEIQLDTRSLGFNIAVVNDIAISDTKTGSTFAAIAGVATGSLVKQRQNTRVDVASACTWFTTAINTTVEFGVNFNNGAGTNVTVTTCREQKTPASSRSGSTVGFALVAAASLPASTYTTTIMWRVTAGAGTASVDSNDSASFRTKEEIAA